MKRINLPHEIEENDFIIKSIGKYQLQAWIDWLIDLTEITVKKQDILDAVDNYEKNWSKLD